MTEPPSPLRMLLSRHTSYALAIRPALEHENRRKRLAGFSFLLKLTHLAGPHGHSFSL